jgi:hypothetical protein
MRIEELVAELVGGVRKEPRDQHAFRGAKSHPGCILGVKQTETAVFELAAAAAGARVVATGC